MFHMSEAPRNRRSFIPPFRSSCKILSPRHGLKDALIFPNHRLSYCDFDRAVDELALGFLAIGLDKGDRLGIWSPNRLEWVLTQFATARIGVILVNINPAYQTFGIRIFFKSSWLQSTCLSKEIQKF